MSGRDDRVALPQPTSALAMILAAAARYPKHTAIEEADGRAVTYAELIARARARRTALRRGEIVEVSAERTTDFIVGCLAAWLAGAAWMPVDACAPIKRTDTIRQRVATWVEQERANPDVSGGIGSDGVSQHFDGPAYVIATSGSTGEAKAVVVPQRGLPALLTAQIDAFLLEPGARSLWLHSPLFDASVSDWGTVLASGATLVIPSTKALSSPAHLRAELEERAITHVDLPPSLLAYVPPADPPASLRVVVLGGEPCPVEQLRTVARRVRVVVVYGPTEATVCSSLVVVDPERWRRPLIGDPLPGVAYEVVDGELWIAGDCLALGYAGDAGETARCFVEHAGRRWYRTGDRVEHVEDGLAFVGRLDRQRKIGGHRVELDEIEAVVRRAPGIRDAAVISSTGRAGGRVRLVAYCDLDPGAEPPSGAHPVEAVRDWVAAHLPAYMLPARYVLGGLPRTPTGKIDRAALDRRPHGASSSTRETTRDATRDALVEELRILWCDALDLDRVDDGDRFRDSGGDSLAALTLHASMAARAHVLAPRLLATNPTFSELVAHVRAAPTTASLTVGDCEQRGRRALDRISLQRGLRSGDAVLITGATGLLGTELVRAMRSAGRHVIALVRTSDVHRARRRVGRDDIDVLCGDITAPNLGLTDQAWRELAGRIGSVVHGAARIDLAGDWDAHVAANVHGTVEVARLVAASGAALHFVSTLSVFVSTDRAAGRHDETAWPDPEAHVFGGYAQTKIAAEAIARAMRGRGAATTIHRLGLLVSESPRSHDQLAMTIRGLVRLAAVPTGAEYAQLDLTAVASAADAITALALRAEGSSVDEIHHIAAPRATTFGQLVDAIRAAGGELAELAPAAWADRARGLFADPDVAMAYLALGRMHGAAELRLRPFDLFLSTGADFAVERTARLVTRPAARLDRFVAGALGSVLR